MDLPVSPKRATTFFSFNVQLSTCNDALIGWLGGTLCSPSKNTDNRLKTGKCKPTVKLIVIVNSHLTGIMINPAEQRRLRGCVKMWKFIKSWTV
jgi:hypothetical protein